MYMAQSKSIANELWLSTSKKWTFVYDLLEHDKLAVLHFFRKNESVYHDFQVRNSNRHCFLSIMIVKMRAMISK